MAERERERGAQSTITALIMPKERRERGGREGGRVEERVCSVCCYEIREVSLPLRIMCDQLN